VKLAEDRVQWRALDSSIRVSNDTASNTDM
jgi:hypothetical protein